MKKRNILCFAVAATLAVSAACLAACDGNKPQGKPDGGGGDTPVADSWHNQSLWLNKDAVVPTEAAVFPTAEDAQYRTTSGVGVHDPSIFQDPLDGTYYAFGTHFAVASSTDLIEWKQEAGDNEFEKLYGNETFTHATGAWPKALEETVKLVDPAVNDNPITTTWAPDVEYIGGKYYMYYSLTKAFGSRESAIARVEADSVMGPYSNNTILFNSMGGSGETPNCIDPELFYDKDGRLWMVYGSTYGGLYVLELNTSGDKVGLPKEEGYGTLIWREGNNVEGPFVFYNATTDYYYLMTSYGSLMNDYNMHIARSKNPNGPYVGVDGKGVDGKDENANGNGNKVAGNFRMGNTRGYAAMGHNSVIKDAQGRYFVVYHTRRQEGTTANVTKGHNLYVSQLYFNEAGWPVMSPNAYVGEKFGTVTEEQVAGAYDIVIHPANTTKTFTNSEAYTLAANGKIQKGSTEAGSWTLKQNFYIELTIGSATYRGVIVPNWNMYTPNGAPVLGISAVSDAGVSLWAVGQKVQE